MKRQPTNLRTALVSVDPRTGAILAYYGGSNGVGNDYAQALRQPGSSFKPFVFAAALQGTAGVGLGTIYDGSSPQTFPGLAKPVNNSEGYDCARCTVKTAMTQSINTVFYKMGLDVTPRRVADAAHQAGVPQDLLAEARGGISIGDQEVHPIDMAAAFGTFAADGMRRAPYLVSKVTAADGRVLYDRGSDGAGEQAMPQQVARNVTESMIDVPQFSGIALADGRPVAGKTGTVGIEGTSQNKDAWMVGYTPSISTAVWVGTDTSEPVKNSAGRPVYGRMLPGAVWQGYMNSALRGTPKEQFSKLVPMGAPPAPEFTESPSTSGTAPPTTGSTRTGVPGTSGRNDDDDGDSSRDSDDEDDFAPGAFTVPRPVLPGPNATFPAALGAPP